MSGVEALRARLRQRAADRGHGVSVSFEFFPPGDERMERTLWQSLLRLAPLRPRFVSVTYRADGSTRERTHNVVARVLRETDLTAAPHLTCVGDPPQGAGGSYAPRADGFAYAVDLVRGLKTVGDFEISVAAYPQTHPEAPSAAFDLDNLKAKTDAGATRAITQFFFDTDAFLRFRDRCGASVPDWLQHRFDGLDADAETRRLIAAAVAIHQVESLRRHGIDEFHFYTLNRAELTFAICHALGVRPAAPAMAAEVMA